MQRSVKIIVLIIWHMGRTFTGRILKAAWQSQLHDDGSAVRSLFSVPESEKELRETKQLLREGGGGRGGHPFPIPISNSLSMLQLGNMLPGALKHLQDATAQLPMGRGVLCHFPTSRSLP